MIDSNLWSQSVNHWFCMKIKTNHILFYVSLLPLLEVIELSNLACYDHDQDQCCLLYCMLVWFPNPLISLITVLFRTKSLQIGPSLNKCLPYLSNHSDLVYSWLKTPNKIPVLLSVRLNACIVKIGTNWIFYVVVINWSYPTVFTWCFACFKH